MRDKQLRKLILFGMMLGMLISAAGTAGAVQSPTNMSYQGKLLSPSGIPINSSGLQMVFTIYNAATGGTNLWTETVPSVPVNNGVFAVQLGNITPIPASVFASSPTYLGVAVGADSEMTPRQLLSASPYAFSAAQLASNNAIVINAGVAYATFTVAGNLQLPFGITAGSATFTSTVTAGLFVGDGSGLTNIPSSTALLASTNTWSAQQHFNNQITVSSNVIVNSSVTASAFFGNGAGLTGITATDTSRVARTGDTMTGALTLSGATANIISGSSVTASAFFGDGAGLTNIPAVALSTLLASTNTWSAQQNFNNQITVSSNVIVNSSVTA
ncbi:MAG: hypothetical protein NTY77_06490, partial [Elusimicrobia bacterium]|nr:hypothetical protein [Elusimicrobiota bacterium]